MIKRLLVMMLAIVMLLGAMPLAALATETASAQADGFTGAPPAVDYRIGEFGESETSILEIEASARTAFSRVNAQALADVDTVEEKVDWIAGQCRAQGFTDEWNIALWLHDWLVYNANYDYTYTRYSPSGVLLEGTGVCQSYAEAYGLLLDEFGIENQLVSSPAMNHAWNLVKIEGQWCHVDCTWDDPGEGGSEGYTYFGMDDGLMGRDHTWNRDSYPACPSKANYYYVRKSANVGETAEQMEQLFHQMLSARMESFECLYIGPDPNYHIMEAFDAWLNANAHNYGLLGARWHGTQFRIQGENFSYYGGTHKHQYTGTVTAPTCAAQGYTTYRCACGDAYVGDYVKATGNHKYTDQQDATCNVCGFQRQVETNKIKIYRLYNPYTHEHLLTGGEQERDALMSVGWSLDGVAWKAPVEGIPVYRLYNPYDDWHTYTVSAEERDMMVAAGWTVDGVVSRSAAKENGRPIYRLYNPYVKTNFHLFTAGEDERDLLVSAGWILEGIAWYAVN